MKDTSRSVDDRSGITKDAVLVTGSSGLIGRHFAKSLAESGRIVVSLYHHRLPEALPNVYPVCSDLSASELLAAPLRGVSVVVHLAWQNSFVGAPTLAQDLASGTLTPNLKMVKNLIAATEQSGTRRFIFMSALGASRDCSNPFLREKYLAECLILNSRIPEKVILRSAVVCGGHDRFLKSILNVMRVPGIYPVPRAKAVLAPVHIDDIVSVAKESTLVKMVDSSAVLEIAGGERYAVEDLFKLVSQRYAHGSRLAIKGYLGTTLLPLFERNCKPRGAVPRVDHFLDLGSQLSSDTQRENPLMKVLPKTFRNFKEVLADSHWP